MNAPNRSADVAAWVAGHRALFVGDADSTTRALLTPLAKYLNVIEGRNVWGLLVKSERTPPFIPHDILMWRDTREHFDVFTGPDSGRAEDVQPVWGYNPAPADARWIWQSVEDDTVDPPAPPSVDVLAKIAALEQRLTDTRNEIVLMFAALRSRIDDLEDQPEPTVELPALVADGVVSLPFGLTKRVLVPVRLARAGDPKPK